VDSAIGERETETSRSVHVKKGSEKKREDGRGGSGGGLGMGSVPLDFRLSNLSKKREREVDWRKKVNSKGRGKRRTGEGG